MRWHHYAKWLCLFALGQLKIVYAVFIPDFHRPNGNFRESFYSLIFSRQWGFFYLFPPMLAACFSASFIVRYKTDFVSLLVSVYLAVGSSAAWRGEMCYRPRYFLII